MCSGRNERMKSQSFATPHDISTDANLTKNTNRKESKDQAETMTIPGSLLFSYQLIE